MSWPCFERTMNPYKILYREESISVEMVWAIMNCLNEELFNTKIYTEVSSMEYLHSAIGGYQHLVTLRLSIMQCIDCISNAEYAPHLKQHSNFAGASSRSHRWKIWMKWFLKIRAFVINVQNPFLTGRNFETGTNSLRQLAISSSAQRFFFFFQRLIHLLSWTFAQHETQ